MGKKKSRKTKSETSRKRKAADVAVVMGSDSDFPVMRQACECLEQFGVAVEVGVVSAHRTPLEMARFAEKAAGRGVRVIIAGAGGAAHLPGMIASHTCLPVIGVPVPLGPLQGEDALLSIVQMPKGVPVATVAIGNAWNAGLLAVQILATSSDSLREKIGRYKRDLRKMVLKKKLDHPGAFRAEAPEREE